MAPSRQLYVIEGILRVFLALALALSLVLAGFAVLSGTGRIGCGAVALRRDAVVVIDLEGSGSTTAT